MPTVYEHTIRLSKETQGKSFKKRAPVAMRKIREIAKKMTGLSDIRIDPSVNNYVWSQGIRNLPRKIRVEMKVFEQENQKFVYTSLKEVESFKGLLTTAEKDQ